MEKQTVPLIEMLQDHVRDNGVSLHVPGHKNGQLFHSAIHERFRPVLAYDVTELDHLDDLHAPTGAIRAAQEKAAQLYRARETHFLVGGTTVGNLAMMYALFEKDDIVFVQRNSHKSIFHAIEISGVFPVFIEPTYDPLTSHPVGLIEQSLEEAIKQYPEAKGIVLTYPNYYGVSVDIKRVIQLAKEAGLFVLVDEAHGPHFQLGSPFPPSTLSLGADVVVQSAHKMLPALTMSSFLHVAHSLPTEHRKRVKEALTIFQSSSPSYLLMASLDGARAYLQSLDQEKIASIIAGVEEVKKELSTIPQIRLIDWESEGRNYYVDPLKVTIQSKTTLTGYELQQLFYEAGLYTEMADEAHVLAVFGLGTTPFPKEEINELKKRLSRYEPIEKQRPFLKIEGGEISTLHVLPQNRRKLQRKFVSVDDALGEVAAEPIIPYPPGVPIVLSGEIITNEKIRSIKRLKESGATFQGHEQLERISVFIVEEK